MTILALLPLIYNSTESLESKSYIGNVFVIMINYNLIAFSLIYNSVLPNNFSKSVNERSLILLI